MPKTVGAIGLGVLHHRSFGLSLCGFSCISTVGDPADVVLKNAHLYQEGDDNMRKTRIIIALSTSVLLFGNITLFSATEPWEQRTSMPTARFGLSTVELNNKVYAIDGHDNNRDLSTMEMYDPDSNSWIKKADLLEANNCLGAAVVNGKIYAFLVGESIFAKGSIEEYDPVQDAWTRKGDYDEATARYAVKLWEGSFADRPAIRVARQDLAGGTRIVFMGALGKRLGKMLNLARTKL